MEEYSLTTTTQCNHFPQSDDEVEFLEILSAFKAAATIYGSKGRL